MPKLPTYTAPIGELPVSGGRRASAEDFGAQSASAAGDFARTTSKVAESQLGRMEEDEARKALVSSSEIRAKYAKALDQAATSGGDLGKLREQMSDELSRVGDGFQTKRGADSLALYTANTDLMFDEQSNRIEVQRAGANAKLEAAKLMQNESAILRDNPLYLGMALQNADALVDTFSRMSPEQKALAKHELRQNLSMSAVLSQARIDPEGTRERLEKGEWELSAEQREVAIGKTHEVEGVRRASQNHARSQAEFERNQRNEEAGRDYTNKIITGQLTGKALENALTTDPRLTQETVRTLTAFAQSRANALANGEKQSNPTVKKDLWMAINAPDGDPRKIYNNAPVFAAVQAGTLNTTDANQMFAMVAGQKDENARSFGTRLQGRLGVISAALRSSPEYQAQPELQAAIQLEMIAQVEQRAAQFRKENKDPSALLDPTSKDNYFVKDIIKQVANDIKQRGADALPPLPVVKTDAEFNALPPGTPFVDSQGKAGIKPERRKASSTPVSERRTAQRGSQEPLLIPQAPGKLDLGR